MAAGRSRKRYVLLFTNAPTDTETRREFTRLILEQHPSLDRKKMVWLERGLIVRTDIEHLAEMKAVSALRVGETKMVTKSASGSISKLKRMASESRR